MMNLEQDHAGTAWGHWLSQFDEKPVLKALVYALLKPAEGLQGALRGLYESRWLDTAEGRQLDGIGEIVGLSRIVDDAFYVSFFGFVEQPAIMSFGEARMRRRHERLLAGFTTLKDHEYRKLLYWKIAINNGHGTSAEISASLKTIYDVSRVIVQDAGNAKIVIWIDRIPNAGDALLRDPYKWVPKAAGVGVRVITASSERPFGFISQGFFGFGDGVLSRRI